MAALEPVYLVLGTDVAKIATVLQRLKAHFPDEAIETYPAAKDSAGPLIDGFQTLGLLAEQRLVIVTAAHDWPADDVSKVLAYLESPSPDVVLLLVADKLASNSRLRKAFAKPRLIECAGPDTPATLRAWTEGAALRLAQSRLAAAGVETELQDGEQSGMTPDGLVWTARIERYHPPGADDGALRTTAYWVTIVVRWNAGPTRRTRSLQLKTLKLAAGA